MEYTQAVNDWLNQQREKIFFVDEVDGRKYIEVIATTGYVDSTNANWVDGEEVVDRVYLPDELQSAEAYEEFVADKNNMCKKHD